MLKKIYTIILALMLILALTACGKSESNPSGTSGNLTENPGSSTENPGTLVADDTNNEKDTDSPSEDIPATSGTFADVSSMDYDEVVAYLDSLPETDASYFTISTEDMAAGEAAIIEYTGTDEVVVIPESIDGLKIVQLSKWSFTNNKTILAVKAPSTVRVIGETAFGNCVNLLYLTGLENVEKLCNGAFNMCLELKTIAFTDSVTEIEGYIVFANQNHLVVKAPKGSPIADYVNELIPLGNEGLVLEEY